MWQKSIETSWVQQVKPLRTSFRLVFSDQMSKFCSGKMMKKLTKQAGTFYHECALFVMVVMCFLLA
jgi:hypothetical protein